MAGLKKEVMEMTEFESKYEEKQYWKEVVKWLFFWLFGFFVGALYMVGVLGG